MLVSDLVSIGDAFPWITLLLAFGMAVLLIILLMPVAHRIGWIDKPSGRKCHEGEIPLIGGWAVLSAMLILQLVAPREYRAPAGYWTGALLIFAVAVADDRHPIRARYRILVQLAAAVAGISLGGQVLLDMGDILGTGRLSATWIVAPITILGTVALINAMNFTDGLDGLCGGLGFISLFWLLAAMAGATSLANEAGEAVAPYANSLMPLAAATMGSLIAFLCFNLRSPWRRKACVFMGDGGSMVLGFTLSWLAIHVTTAFGSASVSPIACLWIVAVPLADTASCIVRRLMEGGSPMTPDLKHLHNLARRSGLTISQSVAAIHLGAFLCGLVGVMGWWRQIEDRWLFAFFAIALAIFIVVTNFAWRRLEGGEVVGQVSRVATAAELSDSDVRGIGH